MVSGATRMTSGAIPAFGNMTFPVSSSSEKMPTGMSPPVVIASGSNRSRFSCVDCSFLIRLLESLPASLCVPLGISQI